MDAATLLAAINAQHSASFALFDRYAEGESSQGAYAVADATGQYGVLKWELDPHPALTMARLREVAMALGRLRGRGYPVPLYLLVGCVPAVCYSIQEMLPGVPLRTVAPSLLPPLLPRLLELNALQRGQAIPGRQDWPARVVDTVLYGGDGYCLHEPLRTYSPETAELLTALRGIVARYSDDRYETADLVHFDFNPANILMADGTISGVIDWQDPCSGDCTFDLVTLLFYAWDTPDAREALWQHALGRVGPRVLGVYLAHLMLRQVDWSIRHHGPQVTGSWLRIAREILGRWHP